MTPALEHRLSTAIAASADQTDDAARLAIGVDPAVAQIMLRLSHDLRRLKEIQSIEQKIEAKRTMLPDYREWCDLRLAAGAAIEDRDLPSSGADDVLPTMMIWAIDTADWPRALELAEHVLRFDVPLPTRYQRGAAPLIVEEIATAALKKQAREEAFPLDVLEQVEAITAGADMHDEIRAKLNRAIGTELARAAGEMASGTPEHLAAVSKALAPLQRAQDLHDRVGAKGTIRQLRKVLTSATKEQAAQSAASEQAGTTPAA
nr:phage terminase small subunit [uncultured Sphingomonas sp.]